MGREARAKRQVIHSTKLFGGLATAQEVHAKWGFRSPCTVPRCGNMPVIQVRMFMLHDEFVEKSPMLARSIAMSNPDGPYIPCAPTTFGPMVRFSTACACRAHQRDLEVVAARAPSYVLVEIDRGPGADKPQVQVARGVS